MENLSHSLVGAALARAGLGRLTPFGATGLVIAANLPDLDSVAGYYGQLYYYYHHRGFTHSLLGTLILGLALAGLLIILNRLRRRPQPCTMAGTSVAVLTSIGTHPLLDWTNSYGWRPLLPFHDEWIYGDLVFIVDPLIWLLLGSGLLLAGTRRALGRLLWVVGVVSVSALILVYGLNNPPARWLIFVWFPILLGVIALKRYRVGEGVTAARVCLIGLVIYWEDLWSFRGLALEAGLQQVSRPGGPPESAFSALPSLANPLHWELFAEDEQSVYHLRASAFSGPLAPLRKLSKGRREPVVKEALETCPGRVMEFFSRFPVYTVEDGPRGSVVVVRDLRFGGAERTDGFGQWTIPLQGEGSRSGSAEPCPAPFRGPGSDPPTRAAGHSALSFSVRAGTISKRSPTIP